ncbi:hypothetical protein AVEN_250840-1 [Araneus ventricosus]|uniref:Uncharacterized protein n=1 Tax=Araneus ventricosus TaxID=182803 RepID=A0A4Y2K2Z9_ARAVE|nr:hypothetical protein AVEN_250840-1 [Araneus ventricosus]
MACILSRDEYERAKSLPLPNAYLVFTGSVSGVYWISIWCLLDQYLVFTGSVSGVYWISIWCLLDQYRVFTGSVSCVHWISIWYLLEWRLSGADFIDVADKNEIVTDKNGIINLMFPDSNRGLKPP